MGTSSSACSPSSISFKYPPGCKSSPEFNELGCNQSTSDIWDMTTLGTCEEPFAQDLGNDKTNEFHSSHKVFDEDGFGGHASVEDDFEDDEDDPWKPLNPHEPGELFHFYQMSLKGHPTLP